MSLDDLLSAADLRDLLGISEHKLRSWIARGMPVEQQRPRRLFDAEAVSRWLLAEGLVEDAEETDQAAASAETTDGPATTGPVAATYDEAAELLGVSRRTVTQWARLPGFPGRPGQPGRRLGYFPINEIKAWHAEYYGEGTSARELHWRYRAAHTRLDLEDRLANLADLEAVEAELERHVATARQILEAVPDEVVAELPVRLQAAERRQIRELIEGRIRQALDVLAQQLESEDEADG